MPKVRSALVAGLVSCVAAVAGLGCKAASSGDANRVVEIRSYTLKKGTRAAFHRRFVDQSLPMLERWKIDAVAYGPSLHDADSYYLMRAYPSVEAREKSEDAFYGSDEWKKGPREAVLADIESYTTLVMRVDDTTLRGLRAAGRNQLDDPEDAMGHADVTDGAPTPDLELLLKLNDQYIAAFLAADVSFYRAHLVDDFVCTASDGTLQDKDAFLADTARGPDVADYVLAETSVRFYGDTAVVRARGVFTRRDGSKGTSRYTDIWVRMGGAWKTVSAQITRIAT